MNRFIPHCRGRRGMVLMEVIIALTIFAAVSFALVMTLDAAMNATKQRNQIDMAVRGMANQMALVHATPLSPGEKDAPDDGSGIAYRVAIAPEQLQDQKGQGLPGIYRITVTAAWKSDGQAETRDISELFYQP
jgi:prepilin-type N-terminal cleavage/methylation domain-containing protein